MPRAIDPLQHIGSTFGLLKAVALSRKEPRIIKSKQSGWKYYYQCLCSCGNLSTKELRDLQTGHTSSCGCMGREILLKRNTRHGDTAGGKLAAEWRNWNSMISRCYDKSNSAYCKYGARGVTVTDRWRGSDGYRNFLVDMGRKPSPVHTIDRRNTFGHYTPENCRWATPLEQSNNQRSNVKVDWRGETMNVSELMRKLGIYTESGVYYSRLARGWDVERAFLMPVKLKAKKRQSKV